MKSSGLSAPLPNRVAKLIAIVAALAMFVHAFSLRYIPDDAFISFRYALNIARGFGPVFNLGQHVEGYTSPLWVFVLGSLKGLGLPIESVAQTISIGCAVLAVLLLPRLSRRLGFELSGFDSLLLAANTSFAVWAGASMEMSAFALVLLIATLAFVSGTRLWISGLLFAGLVLLRPEGMLFGGLAIAFASWGIVRNRFGGLSGRREPNAFKNWAAFVVAFTAPVLLHLLWRVNYYGYPLPNTFYDKVGFTFAQIFRGLTYLGEATWQYLLPLSLPLLLGLTEVNDRKRLYVAVGLLSYLGYVVAVGGDWMVSFRMITLVMPLICLFAAVGLSKIWKWVTSSISTRLPFRRAVALLIASLVLALDLAPSFAVDTRQDYRDDGVVIAQWLDDHCPSNLRLAVYAAGSLAYYAPDFQIVDMFGLTKLDIAHMDVPTIGSGPWAGHEKFSSSLTLQENPNIFIFQPALGSVPITTADGWLSTPLAHLTREFTDDVDFWSNHSTQTAPMTDGRYFNFIVLNPYPCR